MAKFLRSVRKLINNPEFAYNSKKASDSFLEKFSSTRLFSTSIEPAKKIHDVTGGEVSNPESEEGKLHIAQRAKNLIAANRRFQLSTYSHLPKDLKDNSSVHSTRSVLGTFHRSSNRVAIFLRDHNDYKDEAKHIENLSKLANASIMTGHLDPVPLIPVFTRVGLLPPTVVMVGDLTIAEDMKDIDSLIPDELIGTSFKAYWFEWYTVVYVDLFQERRDVNPLDFRSAFIDKLAVVQHEAIHMANTKYIDFLPSFCQGFLGFPVECAFLYSVDRAGMSIFALRADTDDQWKEYRFPFTREIQSITELEGLFKVMVTELLEAEKAQKLQKAEPPSPFDPPTAAGSGKANDGSTGTLVGGGGGIAAS